MSTRPSTDATTSEQILRLAAENKGQITSAMVTERGWSRGLLLYLVRKGQLECVQRGIYVLPGAWEDEFFNCQIRFSRGVYSHETALYLWGMTDRTPSALRMTFPSTYNVGGAKNAGVICSQAKPDWYALGVTGCATPTGHQVRVYNREHTLCDFLRPKARADIQQVGAAFRQYVRLREKNIPLLSEYARRIGVAEQLKSYLEVLL